MQHVTATDKKTLLALTVGAIGVVYGDIGTSPLYTLRECFHAESGIELIPTNIFGILSLILWSVILVVTLKYVIFIMRADNKGEGGVLALLALALRQSPVHFHKILLVAGVVGAALFYGDCVITPAVSVLSAIEGLKVATPVFDRYILPIAILILSLLFLVQKNGTEKVGKFFGPIMLLWFSCLAVFGVMSIAKKPDILYAINPYYAFNFCVENTLVAFIALGAVVLSLTGGEALYADMGHFGVQPIRKAWFSLVLPSLGLNYFGQGALLLDNPEAIENPFFLMFPEWALYPMVVLATLATVIASQAVISGAFSLTKQAIQMGFWPRMDIFYPAQSAGQIYIPFVNWTLFLCVMISILGFKTSSNLAAAYGVAVTGSMIVTTLLACVVMRYVWRWPLGLAILVGGIFLLIDLAFFSSNLLKIADGGWFPLFLGCMICILMLTWKRGREILFDRLEPNLIELEPFITSLSYSSPHRVSGTAVFMTASDEGVPHALLHNLYHNKVLHERIVLLTVKNQDVPFVDDKERVTLISLENGFYRLIVRYGFKETADIPAILYNQNLHGLEFALMETSFFFSRETIVSTLSGGMARWREKIFIWMSRSATSAMIFFNIPTNRVIELGSQVEI